MMRFYRALLHLYPASFRVEYGDELRAVFAHELQNASGPLDRARAALGAVADVVPNALAAHWDVLRQDLRYTARAVHRAPGFALTAVLVVALGVGANTAAFSVAGFVLVRPLPFPKWDRLVRLWGQTPGYTNQLSPANYRDWKAMSTSFSGMGAFTNSQRNLVATGEPQRLPVTRMTADVLSLLGVPPMLGRPFSTPGANAGDEILLSYGLWQSQFAADPAVLGARVSVDGAPHTVVGVMPPTFHFPNRDTEFWTRLEFRPVDYEERGDNYIELVARLRDGVSIEKARSDLAYVTGQLEKQYPKENEDLGGRVNALRDELSTRARLLLLALSGAALCTLLLTCANLANLLLARAVSREREIAVRAALGAGKERLIRQMATESIVLAAVGGIVGVFVAVASLPVLAQLVPNTLPIPQRPSVDMRILGFATLLVTLTGLAFGVIPALRASGDKALASLRDGARAGGGRKQRVRAVLVMTQVMVSVVLLISSGLLVRALWRLQSIDPGFRADSVLTLRTGLPLPKYVTVAMRDQFYSRVLSGVRALPGVSAAAYITSLPMVRRGGIWGATIPGRPDIQDGSTRASMRYVSPQFFSAMRIPLIRGRDVEDTDAGDRPFVAVVSASFAKRFWPGEDPIGKQFGMANSDRTIVGVVGDIRVRGLEQSSEPQVYLPYKQVPDSAIIGYTPQDLVVRSSARASALVPDLRRIVRAADAEQPISDVRPLKDIVANETASRTAQLRVLGILAAIALLLAGVGIHGLLSFTVSRRSQEIGVRMALGARSGMIVSMILREGLLLALGGVLPGLALGYMAARGMEALLVGVRPADPVTILAAVGMCVATVILGCLRPGFSASRVDPMTALRSE